MRTYMAIERTFWGFGEFFGLVAEWLMPLAGQSYIPPFLWRTSYLPAHVMWAYRRHFC